MKSHHWVLLLALVLLGVVLFAILWFLTAIPAIAPTRPLSQNLDDATMQVAHSLYCPVCPGVPLDVCETQACEQWRALIREKLASGQSREQIEQYFVAEYGQRVLGAPKPEGLNLAVYLLPVGALVAGGFVLYAAARSWKGKPPTEMQVRATNEFRERIERELKETE